MSEKYTMNDNITPNEAKTLLETVSGSAVIVY